MNFAGQRILVLEDEPIIAFGLEDALSSEGAKPTVTTSLEEARGAVMEARFDAAILDVNVHGEKSYEFANSLRAANIPLLFATGYGDIAHPDEFAGVPTVTKPYNLAQLRQAFAKLG